MQNQKRNLPQSSLRLKENTNLPGNGEQPAIETIIHKKTHFL